MGICWYCYWGWSKAVQDVYDRHVAVAGESAMHYGPAHIVWDDENFNRESVQWCLDKFEKHRGEHAGVELEAVRQSLRDLLALSDYELDCEPSDYDGEHPENFPPTVEMAIRSPRR